MATVPTPLTYKFTRASGVTTVEINDRLWFAVTGTSPAIIKPSSSDNAGNTVNYLFELSGFGQKMTLEPGNYTINGVDRTGEGMASIINRILAETFAAV